MKASGRKEQPIDQRTRLRALQLRDAALKVRALIEGWQPGARIHAVHVGGFRLAFRESNTVPLRGRRGAAHPRFSAEIANDSRLFHVEWTSDTPIILRRFERGPWERTFLRLNCLRRKAG
jgi:hypothetical protein